MDKIRVVLAEDHPGVIAKIRRTLGEEFEVIKAVENGSQAVGAVLELDPDVFVTDISMPILDGLQVARRIQNSNSRTKIIFLTIHEDRDFLAAALSAGGAGYVTKSRLSTDLVPAIHEALKGHTFVSESMRNVNTHSSFGAGS
ncbi:MAG: response regulator transcription factor [Silvibacterium sp.]